MTNENRHLTTSSGKATTRSYAPPAWLADWTPADAVPVGMDTIEVEMARIQAAMAPAMAKETAVALKAIKDFLTDFGLMPTNQAAVIDAYRAALGEVPADLLPAVVRGATVGLRYSRLPLPADLVAPVKDEIGRRQLAAMRLRTAAIQLGPEGALT